MQASCRAGSSGQGAVRFRHWSQPPTISAAPANENSSTLCSLSQTTCGKTETSDDSEAPAPSATSNAGRAQQINALELAKRLRTEVQKPVRNAALPSSLTSGPSSRP